MAGEIDEHLIIKFKDALKADNSSSIYAHYNEFCEIRIELDNIPKPCPPDKKVSLRKNLYYLHNALTESQTPAWSHVFDRQNIKKKLKEIKSELKEMNGKGGDVGASSRKKKSLVTPPSGENSAANGNGAQENGGASSRVLQPVTVDPAANGNGGTNSSTQKQKRSWNQMFRKSRMNEIKMNSNTNDNAGESHQNSGLALMSIATNPAASGDGSLQEVGTESNDFQGLTQRNLETKVHGFEDELITVENLICPQVNHEVKLRFNAIGVIGVSGIGKTTLCQKLLEDKIVIKTFLPRIWVCLSNSKQPNEGDDRKNAIVKRTVNSLGVEGKMKAETDKNHGLGGLTYLLHLQLIGKRYLIVLDNATEESQEVNEWLSELDSRPTGNKKWEDRFGHGLPKGYGGTVIVTSRSEELGKKMVGGEEKLHRVEPLADPDSCWSILVDAVEKNGIKFNPLNIEDMKKDFNQKCKGLPLAAKLMGQILHEEELKKKEAMNIQEQTSKTPQVDEVNGNGTPEAEQSNGITEA